jgi:hypothetical protein
MLEAAEVWENAEGLCGRIAGNLPSRKDQDRGMAPQSPSQHLGAFDAKLDAAILNR